MADMQTRSSCLMLYDNATVIATSTFTATILNGVGVENYVIKQMSGQTDGWTYINGHRVKAIDISKPYDQNRSIAFKTTTKTKTKN